MTEPVPAIWNGFANMAGVAARGPVSIVRGTGATVYDSARPRQPMLDKYVARTIDLCDTLIHVGSWRPAAHLYDW